MQIWVTDLDADDATPRDKLAIIRRASHPDLTGVKGGFVYAKANEAFALGDVATIKAALTSGTSESGTTSTLTDTDQAWTVNAYQSLKYNLNDLFLLMCDGGTAQNSRAVIASNTADTLTLSDTITSPGADTTYEVVSNHILEEIDATEETICGAAVAAISSGQYGWFQVEGIGVATVTGLDTDPAVAGEVMVFSGTAGALKGFTTLETSAVDASSPRIVALVSDDGADTTKLLVRFNCADLWDKE